MACSNQARVLLLTLALLASFAVLLVENQNIQIPQFSPLTHSSSTDSYKRENDEFKNAVTSFSEITPSETLQWHSCYDGKFYCSRLLVPMDHNRPLNASKANPTVAVALVLLPGTNHKSKKDFSASPVLLNPGGPGGSGVQWAVLAAEKLRLVIGEEHDILGFDPRAVGDTTPVADCFASPDVSDELSVEDILRGQFKRMQWLLTGDGVGIVNSSENAMEMLNLRARAVTSLCQKRYEVDGENSILRHSSTTDVARDMLSIVDAWNTWIGHNTPSRPFSELQGQLLFWGTSYGTLLGNTFAAMYPQRVGRMLLNAVLDATHYVAPVWANSMSDTDAVLEAFFRHCHNARSDCAIYRHGDEERDIKARSDKIMDLVRSRKGFVAVNPETNQPVVITASHIRLQLFSGLYQPIRSFPRSASILDALDRGDNQALLANVPIPSFDQEPSSFCSSDGYREDFTIFDEGQANLIIKCSDKRYNMNEPTASFYELFDRMSEKTAWADVWQTSQMGCNTWTIPVAEPPLPWKPDIPFDSEDMVFNVSHPILYTSSTLDPVCPFSSALKMARRFRGSGVIEQLSEGHGISAVTSRCTIELVRQYFLDGSMPETVLSWDGKGEELWKKCEVDEWPWRPYDSSEWQSVMQKSGVDAVEMEAQALRMDAWKRLQGIMAREQKIGF